MKASHIFLAVLLGAAGGQLLAGLIATAIAKRGVS